MDNFMQLARKKGWDLNELVDAIERVLADPKMLPLYKRIMPALQAQPASEYEHRFIMYDYDADEIVTPTPLPLAELEADIDQLDNCTILAFPWDYGAEESFEEDEEDDDGEDQQEPGTT